MAGTEREGFLERAGRGAGSVAAGITGTEREVAESGRESGREYGRVDLRKDGEPGGVRK
jgi:hypothetical protein